VRASGVFLSDARSSHQVSLLCGAAEVVSSMLFNSNFHIESFCRMLTTGAKPGILHFQDISHTFHHNSSSKW